MIHAIKHVFPAHLVVQFNCTNTIKEQRLENVTVLMDLADAVSKEWAAGCYMCRAQGFRAQCCGQGCFPYLPVCAHHSRVQCRAPFLSSLQAHSTANPTCLLLHPHV